MSALESSLSDFADDARELVLDLVSSLSGLRELLDTVLVEPPAKDLADTGRDEAAESAFDDFGESALDDFAEAALEDFEDSSLAESGLELASCWLDDRDPDLSSAPIVGV